jgi:hypothetical protein
VTSRDNPHASPAIVGRDHCQIDLAFERTADE